MSESGEVVQRRYRNLVANVVIRQAAVQRDVPGIDKSSATETAGVIHRLAERVGGLDCHARRIAMPDAHVSAIVETAGVCLPVVDGAETRVQPVQHAIEEVTCISVDIVLIVVMPALRSGVIPLYRPIPRNTVLDSEEVVDRILRLHLRIPAVLIRRDADQTAPFV